MAEPLTLLDWLQSLAGPSSRPSDVKLRDALMQNPSRASYGTVSDISVIADMSRGAITRTAQSWGFRGWPELRLELRSRYLESLSLSEVASERPFGSRVDQLAGSMDADRRALISTASSIDAETFQAVVRAIVGARHRTALGAGTYRSIADLLATYITFAGYPMSSPNETAGVVGTLMGSGPGDVIVAFDLWRGYASTLEAVSIARDNGASVCLVTDRGRAGSNEYDHVLQVSSESSAFFPTLVPALALVNALAAEVAAYDRDTSDASLRRFETVWRRMRFDDKR